MPNRLATTRCPVHLTSSLICHGATYELRNSRPAVERRFQHRTEDRANLTQCTDIPDRRHHPWQALRQAKKPISSARALPFIQCSRPCPDLSSNLDKSTMAKLYLPLPRRHALPPLDYNTAIIVKCLLEPPQPRRDMLTRLLGLTRLGHAGPALETPNWLPQMSGRSQRASLGCME